MALPFTMMVLRGTGIYRKQKETKLKSHKGGRQYLREFYLILVYSSYVPPVFLWLWGWVVVIGTYNMYGIRMPIENIPAANGPPLL